MILLKKKQENDDELYVREWLLSQGYTHIRRVCDDPPDYLVDEKYAVEVRRLNQMVEINGKKIGEENRRMSLRDTIENVLAELVPYSQGPSWVVDCEYGPSEPLPKRKYIRRDLLKALRPLTQPYETNEIMEQLESNYLDPNQHGDELQLGLLGDVHLCLPCGIHVELSRLNTKPSRFLLQNVSDGEGIGVLAETIDSVRHIVKEKTRKIEHRVKNYEHWWLVLVDHIFYVGSWEDLQKQIRVERPWSRIIILNRNFSNCWNEL